MPGFICALRIGVTINVKRSCAFLFPPHILHVFLLSDLSSIFKSVFVCWEAQSVNTVYAPQLTLPQL